MTEGESNTSLEVTVNTYGIAFFKDERSTWWISTFGQSSISTILVDIQRNHATSRSKDDYSKIG